MVVASQCSQQLEFKPQEEYDSQSFRTGSLDTCSCGRVLPDPVQCPPIADQGASTEVMLLSYFLSFLITVLCPWHLSPQSTAEERAREWLSNLAPATQLSCCRSMIRMQLSLIPSPEFTLQDHTASLLARETVAECFSLEGVE
ncbi:lon protease-like protein 2, peroxisomal [Platysternon megacephalum]|uniref:Lon protease-like protein 2, peroxisomal n=1 Tax=Platysternon megacephalum TaxID=55544 RepID=A0A4D9EE90_9SAUR|nr:lon protease-like protein 2, peroxisomal [Platysternon megacephalum]